MPRRPTQTELFSTDLLDRQAEVERLASLLDGQQAELDRLQALLTASQAEVAALRRELAEMQALGADFAWKYYATRNATVQPRVDLEAFTRDLLKLAHPDKWSQGQPATELAHEIAVALNQRRTPPGP